MIIIYLYCSIFGCGGRKKVTTLTAGTTKEEILIESDHTQVNKTKLPLAKEIKEKIREQLDLRIPPHKVVFF